MVIYEKFYPVEPINFDCFVLNNRKKPPRYPDGLLLPHVTPGYFAAESPALP